MKTILALTAFLFSVSAHAAISVPPDIDCELRLYNVDKSGAPALGWMSRPFKVTREGGKAKLEGITVEATLSRRCAADGGPCSPNFDLEMKTSYGKISSFANGSFPGYDTAKTRSTIPGQERFDTRLRLDTAEASVECTVYGQ